MNEQSTENDRPSWADRYYVKPCASCGAQAGEPCHTASGYVTMRHASRRAAHDGTRVPVVDGWVPRWKRNLDDLDDTRVIPPVKTEGDQ